MPLSLVALSLALDFQFLFREYHDLNFVWQQFVKKILFGMPGFIASMKNNINKRNINIIIINNNNNNNIPSIIACKIILLVID
jgi:hypothetical protein